MGVSKIEQYFYNKEADEIGGMSSLLLGNPGMGKTVALAIKAGIDYEQDRIVFWRGQDTCQWILLAANGYPITLWISDRITEFSPYVTGDIRSDTKKEAIDLENAEDVSVKVKHFSRPSEIVENPDIDRINVYYIPGNRSDDTTGRYYYLKKNTDLWEALNKRSWGNHASHLIDEIGDIASTENRQPFYWLTEFKQPEEAGQFRKNNVSTMATGHDTSDINYKIWKVKFNTNVYFGGANVKSMHKDIDQGAVNGFERGHFVIPGFEKDHFDMPAMPHDTIGWIDDDSSRRLQIDITADVPDIVPQDTAEEALDESPLDKEQLRDIVGTEEAADILDVSPRQVRRKLNDGEIPGIKLQKKFIMSRETLEALPG